MGVFEGPLDLLLYLIHRDELDIYDIPIEKITRQYMAYLEGMKRLDIDIAGEFLVMAATLMLIKSRTLLPVERRDAGDDEEEDDPRLDLVRQLIEYKKFKDAAGALMYREANQAECYLAGGEVVIGEGGGDEAALRLADVSVIDLVRAFGEILRNRPVAPIDHLKPVVWSVPEKIAAITARVAEGRDFKFTELFSDDAPRGEIIVTFLALLELIRQHRIQARQEGEFAEIIISEAA
ncbi:MAG: segregation/condensation protein A [Kiritimatiellae bacterium]|nr:segregation/condensation protein A [Kiritimatiellia bacterium]